MKLSFPQTVSHSAKTAVASAQDKARFASLLNSLSKEAELPSEEQAPAEELLENLESLIFSLQELPDSEQLPELQDLQYAVLQLAKLQTEDGNNHFPTSTQTLGSEEAVMGETKEIIGLLEKIQQKLQILSTEFTREFAASPMFAGAEEKKSSMNLNSLAKISNQLDSLITNLEAEQQKMALVQQLKASEHEPLTLPPIEGMKPVREVLKFSTEITKPVEEIPKIPVEVQLPPQKNESKELQTFTKSQPTDDLQPKVPVESKVPQEPAVQPTATSVGEAGKAAGTIVKTEANPPVAPFVRLANLLEDLGGMLKSSMRLAESQEGMKMRVNIFPEHLGHLEILLTSTNGKLAAQIMASTPMAKEAIELQLNQLRASLVQQGINVEKIEVLQQSSQQSFSQQHTHAEQRFTQSQPKNGTTSHDKNGYMQMEEEKMAERQPSVGQLMKVDYTV